jgi:hypothetical protein
LFIICRRQLLSTAAGGDCIYDVLYVADSPPAAIYGSWRRLHLLFYFFATTRVKFN